MRITESQLRSAIRKIINEQELPPEASVGEAVPPELKFMTGMGYKFDSDETSYYFYMRRFITKAGGRTVSVSINVARDLSSWQFRSKEPGFSSSNGTDLGSLKSTAARISSKIKSM
jgi:hypothetical protein